MTEHICTSGTYSAAPRTATNGSSGRKSTGQSRSGAEIEGKEPPGAGLLRSVFLEAPIRYARRKTPLISSAGIDASAVFIRSGFAVEYCTLADGNRAIVDILIPGDVVGLEQIALAQPAGDVVAADQVSYHAVPLGSLRAMLTDPAIALEIIATISKARDRTSRMAASIGHFNARARICSMLQDLYERLRENRLINRPTFKLPLTQGQIAAYLGLTLVHVNRTMRRARDERLFVIDRQSVRIWHMTRLRAVTRPGGVGRPTGATHRQL